MLMIFYQARIRLKKTSILINDIKTILAKGGFELHKIRSNISNTDDDQISLDKQSTAKTLGLFWNCKSDTVKYCIKTDEEKKCTKRGVFSVIARIFDPLGLVGPVTINAKIVLQKIWSAGLQWDEPLTGDLLAKWKTFLDNFDALSNLSIPRRVICTNQNLELHAFCDASEVVYGACVYLRTIKEDGNYQTRILCSKNKVAPLRPMTIHRLELCGALLLAKLVESVKKALQISSINCYYWTDSSTVLAWLRTNPNKLKQFVDNRVAKIQELTINATWSYVASAENSADILSRGATPVQLSKADVWWHGPKMINAQIKIEHPPHKQLPNTEIPELKSVCCLAIYNSKLKFNLLTKFSSFRKLINVTALILRFCHNIKNKNNKIIGQVNCSELNKGHDKIIQLLQNETFAKDIHDLKNHNEVGSHSKIRSLNPFIDELGIVRVGGRLKNSQLNYNQKHQILIPKNHHITKLIIKQVHVENLHSGCQTTLYAIRNKYWPVAGRSILRTVIHNCLKCYRVKPSLINQKMGNLPKKRVTPTRPFSCTGVYYAGPFIIKKWTWENKTNHKGVHRDICLLLYSHDSFRTRL